MKYLILGNGGREHALAWKLSINDEVTHVYCMEGNGGTAITQKCINVPQVPTHKIALWAKEHAINCVVPGNETVLMEGIVDICRKEKISVFGPHKSAALLEGSKVFAKKFMNTYKIRTAQYHVTSSIAEAKSLLSAYSYPLVIKADGLAAGKGVVICHSAIEAEKTLEDMMLHNLFADAGKTIVLEEYLDGFETSIIAMYDGKRIIPFLPAKDHKKIHNGEMGLNTGGMGVIAPNPLFTTGLYEDFLTAILHPTERALAAENLQFSGFLFFGLMVRKNKCYLLEYNVRFGDPEAQALLPLLKNNLSSLIHHAIAGTLDIAPFQWHGGSSCCVVLASGGYPASYKTGYQIQGLENSNEHVVTFYAGVEKHDSNFITSGGRVFSVVGLGKNLEESRKSAYEHVKNINFEGMHYRTDIGFIETSA